MHFGVLEARMWSVSVVVVVGVPLRARTVLEMVHLDGHQWRARSYFHLQCHYKHFVTAKRSRGAFWGVTKSRVKSFSAVV